MAVSPAFLAYLLTRFGRYDGDGKCMKEERKSSSVLLSPVICAAWSENSRSNFSSGIFRLQKKNYILKGLQSAFSSTTSVSVPWDGKRQAPLNQVINQMSVQ